MNQIKREINWLTVGTSEVEVGGRTVLNANIQSICNHIKRLFHCRTITIAIRIRVIPTTHVLDLEVNNQISMFSSIVLYDAQHISTTTTKDTKVHLSHYPSANLDHFPTMYLSYC